jgi:hypothetical protein
MPKPLGALVVVLLALAAPACGGGGDEAYSPEVERNFTEECVGEAVDAGEGALLEVDARAFCSCTYTEIEATVPFAEFAKYDDQAREDENAKLPSKFEAAAIGCRTKLGYSKSTERTFLSTCAGSAVEEGLSRSEAREYCGCTYAEIKAKVPFEEFAEYDAKAQRDPSAAPPPKMAAAVERCAESLGG